MRFSDEYLDLWGKSVSLTQEELDFFWGVVGDVRSALGVEIEITNRDHESAFTGKSKNANGCFYTSDPKNPSEDCFITIDNFFIHECYCEKFNGELNLSFQSLEEVLCHEIAHMEKFRHGKGHTKLTEELLGKVQAYQKEKEREVTRDFGGERMKNTKRDIERIYDGADGVIYSVEVAPERFVDVKACPSGSVYVMENGDGSMVYGPGGTDDDNYPDYVFDEMEVVRLVKDVYKEEKDMGSLDRLISDAERECSGESKGNTFAVVRD